jgi:hypothetical protein
LVSFGADRRRSTARFPIQLGLPRVLCAAVAMAGFTIVSPVLAQTREPTTEVELDIPSQPLADALLAYGTATGLQVFYDGALAVGHRSTTVKGRFTSMTGLQTLLRGTGYVPQTTADSDTITIVMAPQTTTPSASPSAAQMRRYEPYFAVLQARVSEVLCGGGESGPDGEQLIFSFWLGSSGVISHARVLGPGGGSARRDAITAAVLGLQIGEPPPPGLPQPVTMVIFPPSAGEPAGCPSTSSRRADSRGQRP